MPKGVYKRTGRTKKQYTCAECDSMFISDGPKVRYCSRACNDRVQNLKKYYGPEGPTIYKALLARQGGGCASCGKTEEEEGRRLAIDHDHSCCPGKNTCGKCARAVLCATCNVSFGMLQEDPERIRQLAVYADWVRAL